MLATNPNLAEAQDHTATGSRPAKAHLRAESREKENLVEFALHIYVYLTGDHAIADGLAIGIHHSFDEKGMLSAGARHLLQARHLKAGQNLQASWLQEVRWRIGRCRPYRHTRAQNLVNQG